MSDPFERILLATEHTLFDSGSERLAFDLARRCGVPLAAVMPVLSNPEYEVIAPQLAELAEQEAAAKIRLLYEAATIAGVQIEVNARRGAEPYREIVQEAADRQSDLIVIRRRGERSFLSSLLVGEMVSKVVHIRRAMCCLCRATRRCGRMVSWQGLIIRRMRNTLPIPLRRSLCVANCRLPWSV